ncbi:MAG: DedA family protein [Chloroflexi bacterium]|nr:DedA family protein [Chloroflexota bacterium]
MQDASEQDEGQASERGPRFRNRDLIWVVVIAGVILVGRVTPFKPIQDALGSFNWLTEWALRLAKDLFESYGYLTVFLAPMLENTLFIGAIIPGTLVMLLAGLSAHEGLISFWPAVLLGILGAIIGDTISYGMGRYGWKRFGLESRFGRWAERMREPLLKHSIWLVLSYHFAGYSRLIGPAASGYLRLPLLRWMLLDYIGVTLWVISFLTAGYLLGVAGLTLDDSERNVQIFEIILFGFFVIAAVSVLRMARRSGGRDARKAIDTPPIATSDGQRPPGAPTATPTIDAQPPDSDQRPADVEA